MKSKYKAVDLIQELAKNPRRFLSKAITLVESKREADEKEAWKLLKLLPTNEKTSLRIAVTGAPGVGKSTFIEALGNIIAQNRELAVLSIDPSSQEGGSILGDKTRMEKLVKNERTFVRPSPSGTHLGGTEINTALSIKLCEAAGFETIIVETVGVGQSETEVKKLCDIVMLLLQPKTGDELQGIKKGIMEIADFILINKADGDLIQDAEQLKNSISEMLHYSMAREMPAIKLISAIEEKGIKDLYEEVLQKNSQISKNRKQQEEHYWRKVIEHKIIQRLITQNPTFESKLHLVLNLEMNPSELVDSLLSHKKRDESSKF